MIQKAFVDESMGITQIKEWYRQFKNGTSKSEPCQVNSDYFFDCESVVHYEFAPRGQTINKKYNVEVLKRYFSDTPRIYIQVYIGLSQK